MDHPFTLLLRIGHFYRDGFRQMTWGRTLWIIILVKLFVMFAILRLFFFNGQIRIPHNTERMGTNNIIV